MDFVARENESEIEVKEDIDDEERSSGKIDVPEGVVDHICLRKRYVRFKLQFQRILVAICTAIANSLH